MSVTLRLVQGRINRLSVPVSGLATWQESSSAGADKAGLVQYFSRQRSLFRILLDKTEGLAQLACLSRPGFHLLADLAKTTLATARRTDRELARGADRLDKYVPRPNQVELLIEQTSDLQDRLQRQLALVAQLQEDAAELQAELEPLIGRRQVSQHSLSFDGMRALTRRLISELLYDVTPPVLHPRLALDVLTERLGNPAHARVFAVALATAQLVARVARVTWLGETQVEQLTAAALLQDCGKLAIRRDQTDTAKSVPSSAVKPRHASIGAAITGSYRDAPGGLSTLIARHHWRLSDVVPSSRDVLRGPAELLAAASRFERLRTRSADLSTLSTPAALVDQPAMSQLWRETLGGCWNMDFVRKILVQRDGQVECVKLAEQVLV